MTLDKTPVGCAARVVSVEGLDSVAVRLMEMGMVPGARVRIIKSAPLGDPIQICIGSYHLALRRSEARSIKVTVGDG